MLHGTWLQQDSRSAGTEQPRADCAAAVSVKSSACSSFCYYYYYCSIARRLVLHGGER